MWYQQEHDACGIGSIVNIDGRKDHKVLDDALHIVEKLEHRAGKDATGEVGDGVGILTQISHKFFKKAAAKAGIGKVAQNRVYPNGYGKPLGNLAGVDLSGLYKIKFKFLFLIKIIIDHLAAVSGEYLLIFCGTWYKYHGFLWRYKSCEKS